MSDFALLSHDFAALGVGLGQVVLLHSSLSSLGHIEGGAGTVVSALLDVLRAEGTLVVPAGTAGHSDTSPLYRAAVAGMTPGEVAAYRARMPAFDPATTPSQQMGRIAEHVRTLPGARRSAHPHTSFAAIGPRAAEIVDGHARDCLLGERSPLARLYDADALVLLLGVGYDKCTAFHLAEYRVPGQGSREYGCAVDDGSGRRWHRYRDVDFDTSDFPALGEAYESLPEHPVIRARIGTADTRLFDLAPAVAYAETWLTGHRAGRGRTK